MRILNLSLAALAMAASLLFVSGPAGAKPKSTSTSTWTQYAVPFTCGANAADVDRALPGDYAFAVNVLNANELTALVLKQVQLTYPPGGEIPGFASDLIQDDLPPNLAMQVSCAEIFDEFTYPLVPTGLVQGVLVIRSNLVLDVSASHSARGPGGDVSQDVETVAGRAIQAAVLPPVESKITICHVPPGNPANAHTIVIGAPAWPAHSAHGDYQGPCTNGQ
jgi:hypothetical protein